MKSRIYILLLLAAALQACTERIDFDLNDQEFQRLVVEGWFTNQPGKQVVKLTLTTSYYYNQPAPKATGALVTVSDGEQSFDLIESAPGVYEAAPDVVGEPGKWYTLQVDYQGEIYTATSYMRPVAPIDSMAFKYVDPLEEFGFEGDPWREVHIWTQELPGVGDSYMWASYVNGEAVRDTLREISFADDEIYDGNYVSGAPVDFYSLEEAAPGDTILLEQWNIGREAYNIFVGILNETAWNGGLFDAPPANVETNLSNGALGYFGAAGVEMKSAVIPE